VVRSQAETLYLTQMVDFVQTYHELVDRKRDPPVWESNLDFHIHLRVGTVNFYFLLFDKEFSFQAVLWIGIVLMTIRIRTRIRLAILMPIQIRIRIWILFKFTHVGILGILYGFIHNASLHYFIFLVNVKGVIIVNILDIILKFFWEKVYFSFTFGRNGYGPPK
jgi:hypothetical protein